MITWLLTKNANLQSKHYIDPNLLKTRKVSNHFRLPYCSTPLDQALERNMLGLKPTQVIFQPESLGTNFTCSFELRLPVGFDIFSKFNMIGTTESMYALYNGQYFFPSYVVIFETSVADRIRMMSKWDQDYGFRTTEDVRRYSRKIARYSRKIEYILKTGNRDQSSGLQHSDSFPESKGNDGARKRNSISTIEDVEPCVHWWRPHYRDAAEILEVLEEYERTEETLWQNKSTETMRYRWRSSRHQRMDCLYRFINMYSKDSGQSLDQLLKEAMDSGKYSEGEIMVMEDLKLWNSLVEHRLDEIISRSTYLGQGTGGDMDPLIIELREKEWLAPEG